MREVRLNDLPLEDPNRNTPLLQIGAFYKDVSVKTWREVFPNFGIAKKTYNQLGEVWTNHTDWKATKPVIEPDWNDTRMDIIGSNGNDGLHY